MGIVDNYKQKLGYGVRPNLFEVEFVVTNDLLDAVKNVFDEISLNDYLKTMPHQVTQPKLRDITKQTINVGDESFSIPVSKSEMEEITIVWRESPHFKLLDFIENWKNLTVDDSFEHVSAEDVTNKNGTQEHLSNAGTGVRGSLDVVKIPIIIRELDPNYINANVAYGADGRVLREHTYKGCFPTTTSAIELDDTATELLQTTVTFNADSVYRSYQKDREV